MNPDIMEKIAEAMAGADKVLVATHINPDGDAIGSSAGIGYIARHFGSEVKLLLAEPLPVFLSWLPLPFPIISQLEELQDWTPDLVICVDCGDAHRTGAELEVFLSKKELPLSSWKSVRSINIDHHISNDGFGDINWVVPTAAACGELICLLAEHMDISLQGDLGLSLYLAIASDTGNFSFSNTNAHSLLMAARIVEAGLDVASFTAHFENNWTLERMYLWGKLLSGVRLHAGGAISSCIAKKSYIDALGLDKSDFEGFVSWLRKLRGVKVSLFVREDGPSCCKISLRSMGDFDVQSIAALFDGGGHSAAAGAEIMQTAEKAEEMVLVAICKQLEQLNFENV